MQTLWRPVHPGCEGIAVHLLAALVQLAGSVGGVSGVRGVLTEALREAAASFPEASESYRKGWAERTVDRLLALPGVAVIQLPEPAERLDVIVHRAEQLRLGYYASRGVLPLLWSKLTDAQKLPWLLRAMTDRAVDGE